MSFCIPLPLPVVPLLSTITGREAERRTIGMGWKGKKKSLQARGANPLIHYVSKPLESCLPHQLGEATRSRCRWQMAAGPLPVPLLHPVHPGQITGVDWNVPGLVRARPGAWPRSRMTSKSPPGRPGREHLRVRRQSHLSGRARESQGEPGRARQGDRARVRAELRPAKLKA